MRPCLLFYECAIVIIVIIVIIIIIIYHHHHYHHHHHHCWFARDVTAAMLVVKNKSISLLWELKSIFIKFFEEIFFCFDPQHGRLITWLQTKNRHR